MFKDFNNVGPEIVRDIFVVRNHNGLTLRKPTDFVVPMIKTVLYGEDSLRYFGSKIWELIPQEIKSVQNLATLKIRLENGFQINVPVDCAKLIFWGWVLLTELTLLRSVLIAGLCLAYLFLTSHIFIY